MYMNELELKKSKFSKWLTVGLLAVAGLVVSPIIFLSIKGIIGLAVAALVGFSVVAFTPVVVLKISNAKYRAIEAEKVSHIKKVVQGASENPIETMRNLLIQKKEAFSKFNEAVITATTARNTFKQKCEAFAVKYPARAAEFNKQLENMTRMVELKQAALKDAQRSLAIGEDKLTEMDAYWQMSQDAQELNKAAGMDTGDLYERLKADTACDAVFESVSRAFAQLEVASALDTNGTPVDNGQQLLNNTPTQGIYDTVDIQFNTKVAQ